MKAITDSPIQKRREEAGTIIAQLQNCAPIVLARYPVSIAYLYGSVARGTPLLTSDIDIALILSKTLTPYEQLQLELQIQAALETACGLDNLDVRGINQAPLLAQGTVVQEGILIFCRDNEQRLAFEVLTRKKYFDYLPKAQQMQQAFLEHIRGKGLSGGQSANSGVHSEYFAR